MIIMIFYSIIAQIILNKVSFYQISQSLAWRCLRTRPVWCTTMSMRAISSSGTMILRV